jgi:tetratricopeptide (TPR) repeat protein
MASLSALPRARNAGLQLLLLLASATVATGQKKIACPDGEHVEIDIRQISIQYDASSFAGTLSSLSVLGARLEVAPKKLQEAAVATQQWDEFLKGLAAGYNSCAITRQQYADGVTRIYPRLRGDGAELEQVRKAIVAGQKVDAKRLQQLIDSFYGNLRQFAQASGKEIILERIAALSEQVTSGRQDILQQQKADTELILSRLDQLKETNKQASLPTPTQVGQQISALRKNLLARADEAEAAYNPGYTLLNQYRFTEAIPYLRQALADVPLPDFYLALGQAYLELPNVSEAEKVVREGLKAGARDEQEAQLANQLGVVLQAKGDLDGALQYMQRALKIDETVYGPDHPEVAKNANNIGQILQDKGDLDGALQYAQRALKIDETVYGPNHPLVAIYANNIGQILKAKGDLDGALQYVQRALKIDEEAYGPNHPFVASGANNIGQILKDKGDLDGALQYAQRALKIDEKVYGPDHPNVARDANNIGQILQAKGNLDGALQYTQRALKIDEKVYGPDHPDVAIDVNNIGAILQAKGDLDGALRCAQRALEILQSSYGPNNPTTKRVAANVEQIRKAIHQ